MGELKVYEVVIGGNRTRMNLTEADAERLGGTPVGENQSGEPAPAPTKARGARNKARGAQNKTRDRSDGGTAS